MKNIVLYHDDLDGRAAASIVYRHYKNEGKEALPWCISMDYAKEFPFQEISPDSTVFIVDFNPQRPGQWDKLLDITEDVIWIDHHKTAIDRVADDPRIANLHGLRSVDNAACVLTWKYFYSSDAPRYLKLIEDRDIWKWEYGTDTAYFSNGVYTIDTSPWLQFWDQVHYNNDFFDQILKDGEVITKYKAQFYKELREAISFETEIDGHEALALNVSRTGSEGFGLPGGWKGKLPDEWPILMPFFWDGDKWTVSLYSKIGTVDVSEIAKRRGGGGHPNASGFQSIEMPPELHG